MKQKEKSCFTVYSQKVAGHLMERGFVLVEMRPDRLNPQRNVFFFQDSPELRQAISDYATVR